MEGMASFDSDSLLGFESIVDELIENGLLEMTITDKDNIILVSLDPRDVGMLASELEDPENLSLSPERSTDQWNIRASAPVRNQENQVIGSIRLVTDAQSILDFVVDLRRPLLMIGGGILLLGLIVSFTLGTPLARMTGELAEKADRARRGAYELIGMPRRRLLSRLPLRTRLTLLLVMMVIALVGILELVVIPIEKRYIEKSYKDTLFAGVDWIGRLTSESLGREIESPSEIGLTDAFGGSDFDFEELFERIALLDIGALQRLMDEMRSEDAAYIALLDDQGTIVISDQFSQIGEVLELSVDTQVAEGTYRGKPVWIASTPLKEGVDGKQIGGMQIAVYNTRVETFITESRNLFRLSGLIAVLAGVLLAQGIGSAISAPVSELARAARRVREGDLGYRFKVSGNDELAVLARAYNEMVTGLQEREWLRDMFGRFVSQEVAEALRSGQVELAGENRVVSVLFCDIRNFTARSERSSPEDMVALLNEYLPVVVDAARAHQGTVNKFGGDSTLVIYGAPRPLQESAYHALQTAIEMRKNLKILNERLVARGEDPIQIGVGINTGQVLAGAIGPEARQEYTVIGDTVNLASRIEALNKTYPQYGILISGQTYDALGGRREAFDFVDLGELSIRGKGAPVSVWALEI
jgi:class 3 adenylate cyclase